jgi:YesN/AraC family two-component response regulator
VKNVLIVDDDAVTRGLLSRVLKPHSADFKISTANNGKEAIDIIIADKIDLVITDIQMPEMDGLQLLSYISSNHPEIPVFVMTAFETPEIKSKINAIGSSQYFEKPLNMDTLTDCILEEINAGAEGKISGISLASFMQLVEMEKKTCTLTITFRNKQGHMYFKKGELISAVTGDLKNEKAAYEMISWDKAAIDIIEVCKKNIKEIKLPLINILMEGLKTKDEKDAKNGVKTPLRPLKKFNQKNNS